MPKLFVRPFSFLVILTLMLDPFASGAGPFHAPVRLPLLQMTEQAFADRPEFVGSERPYESVKRVSLWVLECYAAPLAAHLRKRWDIPYLETTATPKFILKILSWAATFSLRGPIDRVGKRVFSVDQSLTGPGHRIMPLLLGSVPLLLAGMTVWFSGMLLQYWGSTHTAGRLITFMISVLIMNTMAGFVAMVPHADEIAESGQSFWWTVGRFVLARQPVDTVQFWIQPWIGHHHFSFVQIMGSEALVTYLLYGLFFRLLYWTRKGPLFVSVWNERFLLPGFLKLVWMLVCFHIMHSNMPGWGMEDLIPTATQAATFFASLMVALLLEKPISKSPPAPHGINRLIGMFRDFFSEFWDAAKDLWTGRFLPGWPVRERIENHLRDEFRQREDVATMHFYLDGLDVKTGFGLGAGGSVRLHGHLIRADDLGTQTIGINMAIEWNGESWSIHDVWAEGGQPHLRHFIPLDQTVASPEVLAMVHEIILDGIIANSANLVPEYENVRSNPHHWTWLVSITPRQEGLGNMAFENPGRNDHSPLKGLLWQDPEKELYYLRCDLLPIMPSLKTIRDVIGCFPVFEPLFEKWTSTESDLAQRRQTAIEIILEILQNLLQEKPKAQAASAAATHPPRILGSQA